MKWTWRPIQWEFRDVLYLILKIYSRSLKWGTVLLCTLTGSSLNFDFKKAILHLIRYTCIFIYVHQCRLFILLGEAPEKENWMLVWVFNHSEKAENVMNSSFFWHLLLIVKTALLYKKICTCRISTSMDISSKTVHISILYAFYKSRLYRWIIHKDTRVIVN